MKNYQNTISVKVSPKRVFDAVTKEMSNWWTEMSSTISSLDDRTTAKFDDGTTWSFEVIGLEENQLIELRCYDANHIHPVTTPEMRTEWQDTVLRFAIEEQGENTLVHFTHIGLTPQVNCYDICHSGWDHFFWCRV